MRQEGVLGLWRRSHRAVTLPLRLTTVTGIELDRQAALDGPSGQPLRRVPDHDRKRNLMIGRVSIICCVPSLPAFRASRLRFSVTSWASWLERPSVVEARALETCPQSAASQ
jgi:hypothetical protein